MKLLKLCCTLLACTSLANASPLQPRQSDASWDAAFRGYSSSPPYAMFTVVDGNTKDARLTCTDAYFLLGAIIADNEWESDNEAQNTALHIVLTNTSRVFTFTRRKALANLPRSFTENELMSTREAMKGLTTDEVLFAYAHQSVLDSIFKRNGWREVAARRDAVACVLMERGESPAIADITRQLYVRQSK